MIFLDTSAIYALADKADPNHVAARTNFLSTNLSSRQRRVAFESLPG